jgi:L-alanine-DL-glutamate epimerase-like enolase superfamily enzyme
VSAVRVTLHDAAGHRGRGEALGVDYAGETPESLVAELEALVARSPRQRPGHTMRSQPAFPRNRQELLTLLPAGGARNALDAALWDLEAKATGVPAWRRAADERRAADGAPAEPGSLTTAYTLSLGDAADVRRAAREYRDYPVLKLKVDATRHLDLIAAVRAEAPSTPLIVDANGSWSLELLEALAPRLAEAGVSVLEQPLAAGADAGLAGRRFAVPIAADESCTDRASMPALAGRYQILNIKLDKSGGLTEALALAGEAKARGFGLMVGNMCGSSLAMAPACILALQCDYIDLDGPLLQIDDTEPAIEYVNGRMTFPSAALWG